MAAKTISSGGAIIYPTDTVYAVGCDPFNENAVSSICKIKDRDPANPMPILCATSAKAWDLVELSQDDRSRVEKFWPGALTVVAPVRNTKLADMLLSEGLAAVRVPAGSCVNKVLGACGPLVGTSANISGSAPSQNPDSIGIKADMLVDGGKINGSGNPSTVVKMADTLDIVRQGAVSAGDLERAWTS